MQFKIIKYMAQTDSEKRNAKAKATRTRNLKAKAEQEEALATAKYDAKLARAKLKYWKEGHKAGQTSERDARRD